MSLRDVQENNPALAVMVLVCLVLILVGLMSWNYWPQKEHEAVPMVYYYDMNTGELFIMPAASPAFVETDSGPFEGMPAGVQAAVFCCGPYMKGSEKFVGYLTATREDLPKDKQPEVFLPEGELGGSSATDTAKKPEDVDNALLRSPNGKQWHSANSPQGMAILAEQGNRCPDRKNPNYLTPPSQ